MASELTPLSARGVMEARVGGLPLAGWMLICVVLGLGLRVLALVNYGLAIDDGATLWAMTLPWGEMIANRFAKGHLPTFFLLFRVWTELAGTSLLAVRLPSLVWSLVAIPVAGLLGGRVGGRHGALIAMGLAALHPSVLRHAAELRMYSWLMVLGGLLVLALLRLSDQPSAGRAAAAGGLHLALLSLHVGMPLVSVGVFGSVAGVGLWKRLPGRFFGWLGAAFAVPVVAVVPFLVHLKSQLDMKEYDKFLAVNPHETVVRVLYEVMAGIGAGAPSGVMFCVGVLLPVLALGLTLVSRRPGRSDMMAFSSWEATALCLGAGVGGPLVGYAVSVSGPQVLGDSRYFIPSTIPLIALMSAALASVRPDRRLVYLGVFVPFAVFAGMYFDRGFGRARRVVMDHGSGMNGLVADLKKQAPEGSQLLEVREATAETAMVKFYLGEDHGFRRVALEAKEPREEAVRKLREATDANASLFYVFYSDPNDEVSSLLREAFPERHEKRHKVGRCRWLEFRPAAGP